MASKLLHRQDVELNDINNNKYGGGDTNEGSTVTFLFSTRWQKGSCTKDWLASSCHADQSLGWAQQPLADEQHQRQIGPTLSVGQSRLWLTNMCKRPQRDGRLHGKRCRWDTKHQPAISSPSSRHDEISWRLNFPARETSLKSIASSTSSSLGSNNKSIEPWLAAVLSSNDNPSSAINDELNGAADWLWPR